MWPVWALRIAAGHPWPAALAVRPRLVRMLFADPPVSAVAIGVRVRSDAPGAVGIRARHARARTSVVLERLVRVRLADVALRAVAVHGPILAPIRGGSRREDHFRPLPRERRPRRVA